MNSRLLRSADGWVAVTLPRPSDRELLPAWIGCGEDGLAHAVAQRTGAELVAGAELLGLAVAALGEYTGPSVKAFPCAARKSLHRSGVVRVLDLSSLWAGPLAAHLLAADGAIVTKAESVQRPDNLKLGRPDLYAELNDNKTLVTFDWDDPDALPALIAAADVVVESARPRALAHRGIQPETSGVHVWASITGYGRASNRVAFGDDAAVAGGLVRYAPDGTPRFKGDAIADPLTGRAAYAAITDALSGDDAVLLDIAMAGVARDAATRLTAG
ncbi:MAG TPA: CoA transferase [Acidimicrobiales bacterium]|nr:CoA transferase [Acidimicrobiales bacterium]